MENKLNHAAIEAYATGLTKKLSQDFFSTADVIRGEEILAISPVKQLNLLIIKNLFQKWKKETSKLQSPYFNYEAAAVDEAFQQFVNTLSKNIAIKKSHFDPLLLKAAKETMYLVFKPFAFYSKEINNPEKSRVALSELQDMRKYIKVNDAMLLALIKRFQEEELKEVFNDEAFSWLEEIYEQHPEKISYANMLQQLNEIHALEEHQIFLEVAPPAAPSAEVEEERSGIELSEAGPSEIQKRQVTVASPVQKEEKRTATQLYEQHLQNNVTTLADIHSKRPIENIKKHISINQRFMFVNELFEGNADAFNQAVDTLDQCKTKSEAMELLSDRYGNRNGWDMESEEVIEFMDIISKRYHQ